MSDGSSDSKRDKKVGIGLCITAVAVTVIFVLITRFVLMDYNIFWSWYFLAAAIVLTIMMIVFTFVLKGVIGMSLNGIFLAIVILSLFLNYYFSTTRVLVFTTYEDALGYFDTNEGNASKKMFDQNPRYVFVFLGNPEGKLDDGDNPSWKAEKLVKEFNSLVSRFKKKKELGNQSLVTIKNSNLKVENKKDADEVIKAFNNMRFSSIFQEGSCNFESPAFALAFYEKAKEQAYTADDFKKKFASQENKQK